MAKEADPNKRPLIVKKVKKVAGGHHGGAWKVAYADFVTAMMAFFLLLWLLSTSSKNTLEGIAEYFTPTTGVKDSMGIGFKGGQTDALQGAAKSNMAEPGVVSGRQPNGAVAENPDKPAPESTQADDNLFEQGASAATQAISKDKTLQNYQENIVVEQTPEGLRITVSDTDRHPMFKAGLAELTGEGELMLAALAGILQRMPNYMTITGHTDASPAEAGAKNYTKWELSTDRAQAARRYLERVGLGEERAQRVVGMADRELLTPAEPRSPRNRRIVLLMLRGHILIPDPVAAALPKAAGEGEAPAAPAVSDVAVPSPAAP